jgi:uroporphyrinogen III methyltransferase/synthase
VSARVYLVGAGPGDPGLLTVRGREVLERADVVVHDRLGTEQLLALCKPGARLVNAGKAPGDVAMTQEQINAALVEEAGRGGEIVRLKGGDPFVFGRGGEEAQALAAAGISFEVVPGVTSAIAAPAAAGIPVTHRGLATSFTVVTGHEDPTKAETQTDWDALARAGGTLVILMGMGRLSAIANRLVGGGRSPDEPVGIVQWGTTGRQRALHGSLGDIAARADAAGIGSPAVIVVGAVAALGPELARSGGPLRGRRVVVTRAQAQASGLAATLRDLGAEVVELPTIRIQRLSVDGVRAALGRIGSFSMIILTSVNGVEALMDGLMEIGADARAVSAHATTVAIGPATARRMRDRGLRADVVPERYVAEGILEALSERPLQGLEVLVARAKGSRAALVDGLRERGANVTEIALYEAVGEPVAPERMERAATADYVTFTSSSTVSRFAEQLPDGRAPDAYAPRVVSIGPITSATARERGFTVAAEASEHTIPGLVDALLRLAGS